jgi:heat shock protein HslJ
MLSIYSPRLNRKNLRKAVGGILTQSTAYRAVGRASMRCDGLIGHGDLLSEGTTMLVSAVRFCLRNLAAVIFVTAHLTLAAAQDRNFPYDSELLLDAKPMKGSKRVPMLDIGPKGEASLDLWCNTVKAQVVVANDTVTILTGSKTERQCTADRMREDEALLAALLQVTNWQRSGDVLTLKGVRTVRFRFSTH